MFSSIRIRLLVSLVGIALFTSIAVSFSSLAPAYLNSRQQVLERLQSIAELRTLEITAWLSDIQTELNNVQTEQYAEERIRIVLTMSRFETYYEFFVGAVRNRFHMATYLSDQLEQIAMLDSERDLIITTDASDTVSPDRTACIDHMRAFCPIVTGNTLSGVHVMLPIQADSQSGYIVAIANPASLLSLLKQQNNPGTTGKGYLLFLDGNTQSIPIADSINPNAYPLTLRDKQTDGAGLYTDMTGTPVVGAYRWIPEINAMLFVEQDQNEAFGSILTTLTANLLAVGMAVILAIIIAFMTTRILANPLDDLVQTTTRIADGDFKQIEQIGYTSREDEIGKLARSFEAMTDRLRNLINTLESRVAERTNDLQEMNRGLQHRALQLETSAQVSREISSILNINDLLENVVRLIQQSFNYYHVHTFLLDDSGDELELYASTAPGTSRIQISEGGLNGRAIQQNMAILSADVQQDSDYREDPDLTQTRSELVVPLRVGQEIIGTLDVHSQHVDAFSDEDVIVLQSLGDQIAIAIENARLYENTRRLAVLEERTRLARNLHDSVTQSVYSLNLLSEGWRRIVAAGESQRAVEFLTRVNKITAQILIEMRLLIYELQPADLKEQGLITTLYRRLQSVENRMGIEAHLTGDETLRLPVDIEAAFYWVAREALNNTLKHASASQVYVRIQREHDIATLEIEDNGQGFDLDAAETKTGMGLSNMRERIEQIGGIFRMQTAPGKGTMIRVQAKLRSHKP